MFDKKIMSILLVILLLFIGCEEHTNVEDSTSVTQNTLSDPSLDPNAQPIKDYFYNFDEGIEAQFLFYNAYITRGVNTINNPAQIDPSLDTLNFRTFPYYIVDIEGTPDTISYMLSLTPENIEDYSTLYPLDETNTSTNNWCNEMLVQYEGNCPSQIEVDFDYTILLSSVTGKENDTDTSQAIFPNILSTKKATFNVAWKNVDSLVWDYDINRYDVFTPDSSQRLSDTLYHTEDFFDSLIYVGIIDTNRYTIDELMFIDRTEWERNDIIYKSVDKPIKLSWDTSYHQIRVPDDSPMYHVNGDCNQNLIWDPAETYYDYGPDMCPDSLETGPDTFTDNNGNGVWDENEPLLNDWNGDGIWTKAFCEVVDTDSPGDSGYGEIIDEEPCNCLGDWREKIGGKSNPNWKGDVANSNWVEGSGLDPNGDNWRDCGLDGKCPGELDDINGDENGTELNYKWDVGEGMEESGYYELVANKGTGEYFIDNGNGVFDTAEFCIVGNDGVCDGSDPFEDRNCNGKWDDEETTIDKGNGIWDDNEVFIDSSGNGNWDEGEPLYALSDRFETFIVDYTIHDSPVQVTKLDTNTIVTLYYGTAVNPQYITYDNFLQSEQIIIGYSKSFHDIDSKVTIYTNKIIEYPLQGVADDYHITKSSWYQEFNGLPSRSWNYGLFKIGDDGGVIQMKHGLFFNYYGYDSGDLWFTDFAEEEVLIYTYNGLLRDGEYYYQDTTIVTDKADYYIEKLYEVSYDTSVVVPFKQKIFNEIVSGELICIEDQLITDNPIDCSPMDTTLTNTYKITKTQTMTMIGNGIEWGLRNTTWYGSAGSDNPLGIVKDQLEIRWSEPYWEEYGSSWNVIQRYELRSLRTIEPELSRFSEIFQPIKHLSLKNFVNEEIFNNDPYVINPLYGMHVLRKPNEK